MRRIFDEENKLRLWLDVEAAVAQAQAAVGDIPKIAAEEIAKNANTKTVTLARTKEIEEETRHDLASVVQALSEACSGEGRKYVHYGLTSMDVEDTATALQFKASWASNPGDPAGHSRRSRHLLFLTRVQSRQVCDRNSQSPEKRDC